MRYLFCDVDGVLNCHRDYEVDTGNNPVLNKVKCEMLLKGLEGLSVRIVLSSVWRKRQSDIDFLQRHIPIFSKTPNLGIKRGWEIDQWWRDNAEESDNYCIVDDDGDIREFQFPYFVQTTVETGLTESHIHRIKWILTHGSRFNSDSKKPA